jgi:hypothetical protein
MPRPKMNLVALDPGSGRAQPGAWVSVYLANTLTLTTLWADDDVSTLANPVQANQLGQVAMRVNPGVYDISMTWDGAQPTVVEDVLAWTPESAVLTTPGDLLVGTPGGGTTRLPVGTENQILVVEQGLPAWRGMASQDAAPAATRGSLLTFNDSLSVIPILPGTQDQALAMAGGVPTWVSTLLPPGTTLPINQPGDLVVGAVGTGLPARLAAGTEGQLLSVIAPGSVNWVAPGALSRGAGQCQLLLDLAQTPARLRLVPHLGNQLWIGTASRSIPDAGLYVAPTGLAINQLYYLYAAWVANAMVLEVSTIGFTNSAGYHYKNGDSTRALVGMAATLDDGTGAPRWVDEEKYRFVVSFFNPLMKTGEAFLASPRTITSLTPVEIDPSVRCHFITWDFRGVLMGIHGTAYPTVAVSGFFSYLALDGVIQSGIFNSGITIGAHLNIHTSVADVAIGAGTHTISLWGKMNEGAATWHGDAGGVAACRTYFVLAG